MTVSFTPDGPDAQAIMTYSQSSNPESPHFDDQSWLYAESAFRDIAFTEEEIAADPELETLRLELD
jgi:acyl-homoserine-lactone acylase